MMDKMKIVSIVGARPQFVKSAVLRKLFLENNIDEILIHTGQHYDHNMSTVFFDEMKIAPPDYNCTLKLRSHGGMTGEILKGVEAILVAEKPDYCLVYGDTNSTVAGALAAAKLHIPVIHVEAGLRSFNKRMPEEINRILTDHASSLLLCSTSTAVENLAKENITNGVHHVGDIMFDAVQQLTHSLDCEQIVGELVERNHKPLACLTLHRQENVHSSKRLLELIEFCRSFESKYQIVFPAHPNTASRIKEHGISIGGIIKIQPLSYLSMQALVNASDLVLTDSGGLQKEAYFHGTRCITLRDETEWLETISSGWNRLWKSPDYTQQPETITEYGEGDAGAKMLRIVRSHYSNID